MSSAALQAMLDRQRQSFLSEGLPGVAVRRNRIDRLMALLLDNTDVMAADYGTRSKPASLFTGVVGMISVVEHTRSHVAQWMRSTRLTWTARLCGRRAEVQPTPLGVVGIIGAWNFPANLLAILPASAAFAAGGTNGATGHPELPCYVAAVSAPRIQRWFRRRESSVSATGASET